MPCLSYKDFRSLIFLYAVDYCGVILIRRIWQAEHVAAAFRLLLFLRHSTHRNKIRMCDFLRKGYLCIALSAFRGRTFRRLPWEQKQVLLPFRADPFAYFTFLQKPQKKY